MLKAERLANARLQHQKQQAGMTPRRSRSRPQSIDHAPSSTTKGLETLSCIIDDSALLAGLKEQNDLKQWIRDNAINVFVPLYSKTPYFAICKRYLC